MKNTDSTIMGKVKEAQDNLERTVAKAIQEKINSLFNDEVKGEKARELKEKFTEVLAHKNLKYDLYTLEAFLCGVVYVQALKDKNEDFQAFTISVIIALCENLRDEQGEY